MDWALSEIKRIQAAARSGKPVIKPRWPMLVLRTPKGLSGPKQIHGEYIEGSFHSHQVPLPAAKTSAEELQALEDWLSSYKPQELFTKDGAPNETILRIIPEVNSKKLGQKKESYANYTPLSTPDWEPLCAQKGSQESCMKAVGKFLREVIRQ
jgi:xylulose-5-phosphate/fructose-6-phosphate phosphoketolase